MNYTSSDILQAQRQYDMFASSLEMIVNEKDRENIYHQLDKLEEKIIRLTNELYEEEYLTLLNRKTTLIEEEKERLEMLLDLINQRLTYIENRRNKHRLLTSHEIDYGTVLGENQIEDIERKLSIITKYMQNIKKKEEAMSYLEQLENKITLASEKIKINRKLNEELEEKMKSLINDAIVSLNLDKIISSKDEIEAGYEELRYSLSLAEENLKLARESQSNILLDCEEMLKQVKPDFEEYHEKHCILGVLEIFNEEVLNYEELLAKREKMAELLDAISTSEFYSLVGSELDKQYKTIKIESQDESTYNYLQIEYDDKKALIKELDDENNSDAFRDVLEELIANERKKIADEKRRQEEKIEQAVRQKQELERKKQAELIKRQRLNEESRKKEIEERTRKLLEEKERGVLTKDKQSEEEFSFETIKNKVEQEKEERSREENQIEAELFEEFNRQTQELPKPSNSPIEDDGSQLFWDEDVNILESDDIPVINNEVIDKDKMARVIPDSDFDSYMKNFTASSSDESTSESAFPDIPV